MAGIVKIDDEVITTDNFITLLKLSGRFESLMEEILRDKLTVMAAKRSGVSLSEEEIQERADQFRRVHGLQRASDTHDYFTAIGVTLDDFEHFIVDALYREKVHAQVADEAAINDYFQANSPQFDAVFISHIVMDSEGAAREMITMIEEEEESFAEMAREHSTSDTSDAGGYIGKVMRGSLPPEVEAKVFNAEEGCLIGPFATGDGEHFEIFRIDSKKTAELDGEARTEIQRILKAEWLAQKAREHRIETL